MHEAMYCVDVDGHLARHVQHLVGLYRFPSQCTQVSHQVLSAVGEYKLYTNGGGGRVRV